MYDTSLQPVLAREHREREQRAADHVLAARLVRLRRLDRRARSAAARARLVRLALQ